jgi:hypothetical protein
MSDPVQELQQLNGIGAVTAQRLIAAGLDTFPAIVAAGEEGLRAISGISPKYIPIILEQAATRSVPPEPQSPEPESPNPTGELKAMVAELRDAIQGIAVAARERFPEELAGKIGHKLTRNMVRGLDALYALEELLERRPKRSRKALTKTRKSLDGLPASELTEIRKGLKQARKTLERVIS